MLELNIVVHGDCLQVVKEIPDKSIDFILTDPPYSFEISGGGMKSSNPSTKRNYLSDLMDIGCGVFNPELYFSEFMRISKTGSMIFFCNKFLIDSYIALARINNLNFDIHVLSKRNPPPFKNKHFLNDLEYIIVLRKNGNLFNDELNYDFYRKTNIVNCVQDNIHPAQKPITLLQKYIQIFTNENEAVLDCFAGSGTTGIACLELNRNYILIEKEKKYIDVINERINNYKLQGKLNF